MPIQHSRAAGAATAVLALSGLVACGKGSNPAAPSTPPPTPAPTPVTTVVRQSTFTGLRPSFALVVPFGIRNSGDLEATADWTLATNNLDLFLVSGTDPCSTGDGIDFRTCTILASETSPTAKPERLLVGPLAAGSYTLYIGNAGPGEASLSYEILLTYTPGSAGLPGAGLSVAGVGGGTTVQVWRAAHGPSKR